MKGIPETLAEALEKAWPHIKRGAKRFFGLPSWWPFMLRPSVMVMTAAYEERARQLESKLADRTGKLEVCRKTIAARERELEDRESFIRQYLRERLQVYSRCDEGPTGRPRSWSYRRFGFEMQIDEHLIDGFGPMGKDAFCDYFVRLFGQKLADELARCLSSPVEGYKRTEIKL